MGLKGQVVAYDRESCVLYKDAFDRLMPPERTAVVMTTQNSDPPEWRKRFSLSEDELDALLRKYKDPDCPLKLLIVTSRLLAGFDAPINQAMYLDKPMKEHGLLQAICRTNRPYRNKSSGLIVDYIGIFDDVVRSLKFDHPGMDRVVSDIMHVEEGLPDAIERCLEYFPDVDRSKSGYEGLAEAQACVEDFKVRDEFAADYLVLSRYWEILSPRISTAQYIADYKWLTLVYESIQPPVGRNQVIWKRLGPKTIKMIQDNIKVLEIEDDLETLVVDPDILKSADSGMIGKKHKQIELKITRRIKRHGGIPEFVKLGERLESAREKYLNGIINSVEYLKRLLDIARDVVAEERMPKHEEPVRDNRQALTRILEQQNLPTTPKMISRIVTEIDKIVKDVRFEGWQHTIVGEREVQQKITKILFKYRLHKDNVLFAKIYDYIRQHY